MSRGNAIFGGAGLGILIGLLIGMSTTGTVGLVIGALSTILVVLLGFKEKGDSGVHAWRVGSFGLFCAIAILAGVYFRAHNTFAPSVDSEIRKWTSEGQFSQEEAKTLFLYERFGFVPPDVQIDTVIAKKSQSVLYASDITLSDCEKLEGYQNFPIQNELEAYKRLGGTWESIATAIKQEVEVENQRAVLHHIQRNLCNSQ